MVKFTVPGIEGEFEVDEKAATSYRVLKRMAQGDERPAGVFEAVEALFPGNDEKYMDRLGGSADDLEKLVNAAFEAVKAKNSRASSPTSNGTAAK